MIEIRHLHLIKALYQTNSITKSAKILHVSQPAVSRLLKDLEYICGAELIERKSKPVKLTAVGHKLYNASEKILAEVEMLERGILSLKDDNSGELRIAVECHSCFDWLMPAMDKFRESWPEVEMDLVSGFHAEPVDLIKADKADLVIVSSRSQSKGLNFQHLFDYEVVGLLGNKHDLKDKSFLTPKDFSENTLITYPIPDKRIDVIRDFLKPAGVKVKRRDVTLTIAILQLVASMRGVAAMPLWAVYPYLEKKYILSKKVGKKGLSSSLYAATSSTTAKKPYMIDFFQIMKTTSLSLLKGIKLS